MTYIYEKKIGERLAKAYNKGWPVDLRIIKELDEVYEKAKAFDEIMKGELDAYYDKAKAFDEIEQAYWKSNTPENFAYEFVGIFEKHFSNGVERADDER